MSALVSRKRRARRGLTLLEVLVSVGILALVATLTYGAFDGMARSRQGMERVSDRYHQGRTALGRMSREIQSAFLSLHRPLTASLQVSQTAFVGTDRGTIDRVDFTSFSHRRIGFGGHESDQNELSYFVSPDPETGVLDLVRRESKHIDMDPQHGGVVQVLAHDIERFNLSYLDPLTGEWTDSWDSTQPSDQLERLPKQVRIELVLKRKDADPFHYVTKVPLAMQGPLTFSVPQ